MQATQPSVFGGRSSLSARGDVPGVSEPDTFPDDHPTPTDYNVCDLDAFFDSVAADPFGEVLRCPSVVVGVPVPPAVRQPESETEWQPLLSDYWTEKVFCSIPGFDDDDSVFTTEVADMLPTKLPKRSPRQTKRSKINRSTRTATLLYVYWHLILCLQILLQRCFTCHGKKQLNTSA
jgi:hypothetical protein